VPRDAPEQPSAANDRHKQQLANIKLAQALNPRATHENTLVMRRSLGLKLDKPVTVAAEGLAAVNVYQRVRCRPLYSRPVRHDLMKEWVGMSQRPFWRWLLLDKEWAWMSRRPLWQYLLFHWARAVLGGLTALAVVAPLLRSFSPFSFVVWYIVGATLGTVFISPRRWRRGQAQMHPASSDTQN
jgi:hypothetical protein